MMTITTTTRKLPKIQATGIPNFLHCTASICRRPIPNPVTMAPLPMGYCVQEQYTRMASQQRGVDTGFLLNPKASWHCSAGCLPGTMQAKARGLAAHRDQRRASSATVNHVTKYSTRRSLVSNGCQMPRTPRSGFYNLPPLSFRCSSVICSVLYNTAQVATVLAWEFGRLPVLPSPRTRRLAATTYCVSRPTHHHRNSKAWATSPSGPPPCFVSQPRYSRHPVIAATTTH